MGFISPSEKMELFANNPEKLEAFPELAVENGPIFENPDYLWANPAPRKSLEDLMVSQGPMPSLEALREGKLDTMDRSETLGNFWGDKDPIPVHLPSNDSVIKTLPLSSFAYI